MRRFLAACAAMFAAIAVLWVATPAWAATMNVTIENAPAKIFYNTAFTIKITYKNTSGGTLTNPHPVVFLYPTPNLPLNHCNPGFRASMAELTLPSALPISEHESEGGSTNCHVWWGFDLSHSFSNMGNGTTRSYSSVKITARPPNGITALNLRVSIINPSAPDEPYGTTVMSIPVATLPPPPSPITPTTHAPTPTASPTPEPSPTDIPTPSATASDQPLPQPSIKPAASEGLGWWWIVSGVLLVAIGGALLVLLFRWRSQPDELE